MKPRCFYYGCWNEAGHYMHHPGGRSAGVEARRLEYFGDHVHIDGSLAPRRARSGGLCWVGQGATREQRQRLEYDSGEYQQGLFLLHHLDSGFSAIQWWDRTQGDTRPGCNGSLLLEGQHSAEEMIAALREHFPQVAANLDRAGVQLVEVKP